MLIRVLGEGEGICKDLGQEETWPIYGIFFFLKCVYGIKHRGEHDKKDEERWAYADHAAKNLFFVRKAVRSH